MEREQILIEIQEIVRNILEDESIVLSEKLKASDIRGWDSMAHLNIIGVIENHFKVKLSVGEIVVIKNIGDLVTILKKKIDAKNK